MTLFLGAAAVDFDLPGVDGRQHKLSDYADKQAVAVVFSCNHCPYVLAWEDRLIQLQADYADKGVQLILIGANDGEKYPADSFEKMQEHAEEKSFNFPYLRDETQEIARAYGAQRTPEIFLFDKSGVLRYHGTVDDSYDDPNAVTAPYFRNAIDAVLAGQAPEVADTAPVGCTIKWKA
ncbi:MAG: thioredoxin family protein [Anaerolineae bacterium]